MVKEHKAKLAEGVSTIMGQKGYKAAMHTTKDTADGEFLTKSVAKYTEQDTQAKARMAKMEAKFEENSAMLSLATPGHQQYYGHPITQEVHFAPQPATFQPQTTPATIHVPTQQ